MRTFVKVVVALSVFCGIVFAQPKPKAAVYIMGNPEGRDALRMAVNTFLIKSGKYQMVAVDAIDVVAREQKRQMSGSVSDGDIAKLGRDAGAEYVCVVERSDLDGYAYVATRMVSVQSKVAEFADIVELPHGGKMIDIIQWQIGSMLGMAVGPRPSGSAQASAGGRPAPVGGSTESAARTASAATSSIQGTIVPGGSLAQKLIWLQKSADSHTTYIVEVNTNETITPYTFEFKGAINVTIAMRGIGGNRIVRLQSHGTMFTVKENVTFVLDNNITLQGHNGNTGSMVKVERGMLKMNTGASITGNSGGGVYVWAGTFEMSGGTISWNGNSSDGFGGGGVDVSPGTFTMTGGTISNNTAFKGGGVYVGCYGACMSGGTFLMRGGTIIGNTAREYGGGVYVDVGSYISFTKTGGTIIGYSSDQNKGNAVRDNDGNILARRGHAVSVWEANPRKETTVGPDVNLSYSGRGQEHTGVWDQ